MALSSEFLMRLRVGVLIDLASDWMIGWRRVLFTSEVKIQDTSS